VDHSGALVAGIDELEEQVAAARNDWQISDLLHNQERGPAKESRRIVTAGVIHNFVPPPKRNC
jgi:hypothetical protein